MCLYEKLRVIFKRKLGFLIFRLILYYILFCYIKWVSWWNIENVKCFFIEIDLIIVVCVFYVEVRWFVEFKIDLFL